MRPSRFRSVARWSAIVAVAALVVAPIATEAFAAPRGVRTSATHAPGAAGDGALRVNDLVVAYGKETRGGYVVTTVRFTLVSNGDAVTIVPTAAKQLRQQSEAEGQRALAEATLAAERASQRALALAARATGTVLAEDPMLLDPSVASDLSELFGEPYPQLRRALCGGGATSPGCERVSRALHGSLMPMA